MFCEVKGRARDGFGKLVRAGTECLVEYFDSPTEGGLEICQVPKAAIVRTRRGHNTWVYVYRGLENRCRAGRVQEDDGEGVYVRFSHKEDSNALYTGAFVRWTRRSTIPPKSSRASSLKRRSTPKHVPNCAKASSMASPSVSSPCSRRRSNSMRIRLMLSGVLNDPSQRYSMVDEVHLDRTPTGAEHIYR